jgi:hypothetical protein
MSALSRIAAQHQAALREIAAPATEPDRARNTVIAQALHEYADRLDAAPLDCTALTGPYWYGQGWRDAVNHLRDLADGLMPAPQGTGGER